MTMAVAKHNSALPHGPSARQARTGEWHRLHRSKPSVPTGTTEGEVVFNTSMCGYQEILTDPSYKGQIVSR